MLHSPALDGPVIGSAPVFIKENLMHAHPWTYASAYLAARTRSRHGLARVSAGLFIAGLGTAISLSEAIHWLAPSGSA